MTLRHRMSALLAIFVLGSGAAGAQQFSVSKLLGVPGPKVNFGSCQAPLPAVQLTPGALDFGAIAAPNSSPPQTVTLRNVGNNLLQINSIDAQVTNFETGPLFQFATTCPVGGSIPPGASCLIDVHYDASQSPLLTGQVLGSLSVFTNAPSGLVWPPDRRLSNRMCSARAFRHGVGQS